MINVLIYQLQKFCRSVFPHLTRMNRLLRRGATDLDVIRDVEGIRRHVRNVAVVHARQAHAKHAVHT